MICKWYTEASPIQPCPLYKRRQKCMENCSRESAENCRVEFTAMETAESIKLRKSTNMATTLFLLLLAITAASSTAVPEQEVKSEQEVAPKQEVPHSQKGVTLSGLCKMECNKLGCSGFEILADSSECTCVSCEEPGEGRDSVKITFVGGTEADKAVEKGQLEWTRVQLDTSNMSAKNATCNNECGHLGCSHFVAKSDEDKCICSGCNLGEVEEDSRSGREGVVIRGKRWTPHCYYEQRTRYIYKQVCNTVCVPAYYQKQVCPDQEPCSGPDFSHSPRRTPLRNTIMMDVCPV